MKEANQRRRLPIRLPIYSSFAPSWRLLILLPLLLFTVGCGGGSSGGSTATGDKSRNGRLALRIKWPAPAKAVTARRKNPLRGIPPGSGEGIPTGTLAIVVAVNDLNTGASLATPITVLAPSGGFGVTQDVEFDNLPIRLVTVSAKAYPDAAAQELPLATGSAAGQVIADTITPITVPLELTASTIEAAPGPVVLQPSMGLSTATLTAVVRNTMAQPVQFPIEFFSNDQTIVTVTPDPMIRGKATVTAVATGSTTIFILEPNSLLSTTVTVTVNP